MEKLLFYKNNKRMQERENEYHNKNEFLMLITFYCAMIVTMLDFLNANLFSPFSPLFNGKIIFFDLLCAILVDIRMVKYVFVEYSELVVA